jgi:nucleolar protein 58
LKAFKKFENTTDALSAVTGIVEGKMPKNLKKFLETEISEKEMKKEKLIISDPKLGTLKKEEFDRVIEFGYSFVLMYRFFH